MITIDRDGAAGPTRDELDLLGLYAGYAAAAIERQDAEAAQREASALRRSRELQQQFLSRLSHELRTPLTAIRGYASSLLAPDIVWDDDSQQRFLETIAAESARLGRLVDDLLDFSAIDSGLMRMQFDWCELDLVLDAAIACLPDDWRSSVTTGRAGGTPVIWADHDRLEQVFVNLLNNAFRHNPPGTAGDRGGAGAAQQPHRGRWSATTETASRPSSAAPHLTPRHVRARAPQAPAWASRSLGASSSPTVARSS